MGKMMKSFRSGPQLSRNQQVVVAKHHRRVAEDNYNKFLNLLKAYAVSQGGEFTVPLSAWSLLEPEDKIEVIHVPELGQVKVKFVPSRLVELTDHDSDSKGE